MTKKLKKEKARERSMALQNAMEKLNRRCRGKKSFETEIQAWSAGKFAFRNCEYFRTYFCTDCDQWHITTKEKHHYDR